jgi:hypothetical protein
MVNAVKTYKSTDQGAPVLTGEVGKLIDLLTAVLVDGYATASVSGITRSGSVATVTLADANSSLTTGDWVTIAGANQADYNGEHQITVTSGTTFTYAVANSPATPATGTITYKKSGAGWTKPFTGTNKAAFRGAATNNSAQFYVRLDESGGTTGGQKECAVRAYESMSDVDTGTGPFPTVAQAANGLCWRKSNTADSTARAWTVVADDRGFYLQVNHGGTAATTSMQYFGWFPSYKAADAYNCVLAGDATFNTATAVSGLMLGGRWNAMTMRTECCIARSGSQIGGAIGAMALGVGAGTNDSPLGSTASTSVVYPNASDDALWQVPVLICDGGNNVRGRFPGAYAHAHAVIPVNNYDLVSGVNGLPGVTEIALDGKSSGTPGMLFIDITGPWA